MDNLRLPICGSTMSTALWIIYGYRSMDHLWLPICGSTMGTDLWIIYGTNLWIIYGYQSMDHLWVLIYGSSMVLIYESVMGTNLWIIYGIFVGQFDGSSKEWPVYESCQEPPWTGMYLYVKIPGMLHR